MKIFGAKFSIFCSPQPYGIFNRLSMFARLGPIKSPKFSKRICITGRNKLYSFEALIYASPMHLNYENMAINSNRQGVHANRAFLDSHKLYTNASLWL